MRSSGHEPSSTSAGATYLDRDRVVAALRAAAAAAAAREPRIRRVILFGSLVRGIPTPASDADLAVVLASGAARRRDRIPELLRLLSPAPLPLDLHPYTEEEWDRALEQGDPVAGLAEREGLDLLA